MDLFPIGVVNTIDGNCYGTMYGKNYTFFEPNKGVNGSYIRNLQSLTMQDKLIDMYKRNDPFRQIEYSYSDIFEYEFTPIEKFTRYVEGGLDSFYVVDLSCGEYVAGAITTSITLDNTQYYSTITSSGASFVFAWNGVEFLIGSVASYNETGITLTQTHGVTSILKSTVYPIYEVWAQPGTLDSFKTTGAYDDEKGTPQYGWLREGTVSFITKYPVRI